MFVFKKANFWENFLRLINIQEFKLSNRQENLELVVYSMISFAIPLVFKHPQVAVGSFVNMALVLSALNLRGKKLLPIILFPSLGALTGGYLFGGLTIYLVYMVPFIWIGNSVLVLTFKYLKLKKNQNFFLTLGVGSAAKACFLFGVAYLLVFFSVVPAAFLAAMGAMQLITALTGGSLAFAAQKFKNYQ